MNSRSTGGRATGRGGARPGAGRKPTGASPTMSFRIDPALKGELCCYLDARGIGMQQFVREALENIGRRAVEGRP